MKKAVELRGHVAFPLAEGRSAYIACDKGILQTSKVVKIFSDTKELVHFETMNSVYKVIPDPSPVEENCLPLCA